MSKKDKKEKYVPPSSDKDEKISHQQNNFAENKSEEKHSVFRIVGTARPSKTGLSLSIRLMENNKFRFLSIPKSDLNKIFSDTNGLTIADVREYDNEKV